MPSAVKSGRHFYLARRCWDAPGFPSSHRRAGRNAGALGNSTFVCRLGWSGCLKNEHAGFMLLFQIIADFIHSLSPGLFLRGVGKRRYCLFFNLIRQVVQSKDKSWAIPNLSTVLFHLGVDCVGKRTSWLARVLYFDFPAPACMAGKPSVAKGQSFFCLAVGAVACICG